MYEYYNLVLQLMFQLKDRDFMLLHYSILSDVTQWHVFIAILLI